MQNRTSSAVPSSISSNPRMNRLRVRPKQSPPVSSTPSAPSVPSAPSASSISSVPSAPSAPSEVAPVGIPVKIAPLYRGARSDNSELELFQLMQQEIDKLPRFEITETSVSILSIEEMEKLKVCDIDSPAMSGPNSVNDPRLGPSEAGSVPCHTCRLKDCIGHYGLIRFNEPVYNPLFIRQVVSVLNSVCSCCSCLLTPFDYIKDNKIDKEAITIRLSRFEDDSKGKSCSKVHPEGTIPCYDNPVYKIDKGEGPIRAESKESTRIIDIVDVLKILDHISTKDALLLGFGKDSHPRNMILRGILVLPVTGRPTKRNKGNLVNEKITSLYARIVKNNLDIKADKEIISAALASMEKISNEVIRELKESGTPDEFLESTSNAILARDGEYQELKKSSDRRTKLDTNKKIIYDNLRSLFEKSDKYNNKYGGESISLCKMLQGKEGLMRAMSMGKATNQCGRTVIGPDPSLRFNQIAIPYVMTNVLTTGHTVCKYNLEESAELVERGEVIRIKKGSGPFKGRLTPLNTEKKRRIAIEIGDVLHRRIRDGDIVKANRQPTLHHVSLMAFEVVLSNRHNIGLHPSHTTPLNADHDGDEMNLWIPQDYESKAEARVLMTPEACLTSTENAGIYMGLVMDNIDGAYLLTEEGNQLTEEEYNSCRNLISCRDDFPTLQKRLDRYLVKNTSGAGLFSALLPAGLFYDKGGVKIRDGILISGQLKKEHLGPSNRSIAHEIWKMDYRQVPSNYFGPSERGFRWTGKERASYFITDANWMLTHYCTLRGLSMSYSDCVPEKYEEEIKSLIAAKLRETNRTVEALQSIVATSELEKDYIRKQILGATRSLQAFGTKLVMDALEPKGEILPEAYEGEGVSSRTQEINNLLISVKSGAKGQSANVSQIAAMIGQQLIEGEQIKASITNNSRRIPTQSRGDDSIEAAGYCVSSFSKGSTPAELFLQSTPARLSVLDTSTKVPVIGDLQRKMFQSLRDIVMFQDGSVRFIGSVGTIIQYSYGDTGMAVDHLVRVKAPGHTQLNLPADIHNIIGKLNEEVESRIREKK